MGNYVILCLIKIACQILKFLCVPKTFFVMLGKNFLAELHPQLLLPHWLLLRFLIFVYLLIYCRCDVWVCARVCEYAHVFQVGVEARGQHQVCSSVALPLIFFDLGTNHFD